MDSFVAIIAGAVVGGGTGRILRNRAFGTVADVLLGITGALTVCWIVDMIDPEHRAGIYEILFVVCGAALATAMSHVLSSRLPRLSRQRPYRSIEKSRHLSTAAYLKARDSERCLEPEELMMSSVSTSTPKLSLHNERPDREPNSEELHAEVLIIRGGPP